MRPSRRIRRAVPRVTFSHCTGIVQDATQPPAQLTVKTPSCSESRLISRRPCKSDTSSAAAPSIPISSSVVKTTSSAGRGIDGLSRIASAIATAIPSSPPSVVPSARTKSPSMTSCGPSRSISIGFPAAFSQTISKWPCKITGSAAS